MNFYKYQHIERFGTDEVLNIDLGVCYIFPKIDGTNSSVWNNESSVKAGSRNRELTLDNDNAGFCDAILYDENICKFVLDNPLFRLFGEWLVPHSLKTYRESAWKQFYIFDVMDSENEYLSFDAYESLLKEYNLNIIYPLAKIKNPSLDQLYGLLNTNNYLIKDDAGSGEGIVIKNYKYRNKYGRQTWAKIVRSEFKEENRKVMGVKETSGTSLVEQEITDRYVSKHLIDKTYEKIRNDKDGWTSKYIPQLLNTVYYDLIKEETWNFLKFHKNPTIDFRKLHYLTILKIKELKPELF